MRSSYFDVQVGATVYVMPVRPAFTGEPVWMITSVGVQRAFRGRGHASRLLDEVVAAADLERSTLVLSVEPDGTGLDEPILVAFYARKGFRPSPGVSPHGMTRYPRGEVREWSDPWRLDRDPGYVPPINPIQITITESR